MKKLKIKIEVLSPIHLGSSKADVVVDAEAVHDQYGMPLFPSKRLKGLLYESAVEMAEIIAELETGTKWFSVEEVNELFGIENVDEAGFRLSNFTVENYDIKSKDWEYLSLKYNKIFNREEVWKIYSRLRYSTAIGNNGVALKTSLRNMRVVDKNVTFFGDIQLFKDSEVNMRILEYALLNLRYVGAKRTRGCGEVKCSIIAVEE